MNDTGITGLDPAKLPRFQPRRFVDAGADLTDADTVVNYYNHLLERDIQSSNDLSELTLDLSELCAAIDQDSSVLYIRMTCQTDDPARVEAYENFVKTVPPAVKPLSDKLDRKYLEARERFALDDTLYEVYDRNCRASVELYRDENVPIQTELALLSQKYQAVCGAMTVEFDGQERTLPEMNKFLLENDRDLRERAFRATADRRLTDADAIDGLLDEMIPLRLKLADNADCDGFEQYMYRAYHRFDYTPAEAEAYADAVEHLVVPLLRKVLEHRREQMGLDALRPWDTKVDALGREPLRPFEKAEELIDKTHKVFTATDAELGKQFEQLRRMGLLDLASRKGKAPGGYQCTLGESRKPFIFMNAVGLDRDVRTLLHEGGHAFHALAAADQPLHSYRHAPMEFCEVASMGMELLAGDHLEVFYPDPAAFKRSERENLEDVLWILPWVATIDTFQRWLYAEGDHDRDQRSAAWLGCFDRFSGQVVDWTDLDAYKARLWHRQLHIFEVPFYYIEYGIAELGALQLWVKAKADPAGALAGYKQALQLGGSRPLPELFEAAGLKFDFSESTIGPLVRAVEEELTKL